MAKLALEKVNVTYVYAIAGSIVVTSVRRLISAPNALAEGEDLADASTIGVKPNLFLASILSTRVEQSARNDEP